MSSTPNPIDKYELPQPDRSGFDYLGHTGRWYKVIEVNNTSTVDFTGSNYGAGGIILTNTNCTIHLSGGGTIPGTALSTNTLYEFSVSKVVNAAAAKQYVLIRNGVIR